MAVVINSYPLNNTLYTAEDAQLYTATRTNGIYSSEDDFVVTAVTDQPLQISVSTGLGWIRYDKFGGFVVANRVKTAISLATSHAMFSRIDRVVIRYNIISNQVEMDVKQGNAVSNPSAPVLLRDASVYELGIADIKIEPGQTLLKASSISDTRMNESLCGLMSDGVTRIPTQELYDAWYQWYSTLKAETDEKIRILNEWIETFRENTGDAFDAWFEDFKNSRSDQFQLWMDGLGEQLASEVGSALFGFAIEENDLYLYYDNEVTASQFSINTEGELEYDLDGGATGTQSTTLSRIKESLQELEDRVDIVEQNEILSLIPVIEEGGV